VHKLIRNQDFEGNVNMFLEKKWYRISAKPVKWFYAVYG